MVVTFEGKKGTGMALSSIAFAYQEYLKGNRIVCNQSLGHYTYFDRRRLREELSRVEAGRSKGSDNNF